MLTLIRSLVVLLTLATLAEAACAQAARVRRQQSRHPAEDEDEEEAEARARVGRQERAKPLVKREVPDYDGRGPDPVRRRRELALWVPRILLSPLYIATQSFVRTPLGGLATEAERGHWPSVLMQAFTFSDAPGGIVPIVLIDTAFEASGGVYFWMDDLFGRGGQLRLRFDIGRKGVINTSARSLHPLPGGATAGTKVSLERRPDFIFGGFGPDTTEGESSKYRGNVVDAEVFVDLPMRVRSGVSHSSVRYGFGVRWLDVADVDLVATQARLGQPLPAGFPDGFLVFRQSLSITVDTRRLRPAPGSGVRFQARAQLNLPLESATSGAWIRYGATLGGYIDLTGRRQVLGLVLDIEMADPFLDGRAIPFTERVDPAETGANTMLGFPAGRLLDRSAMSAMVEYRWPIWVWLSGVLHLSTGSVFGPQLRDLDPDRLRLSFGAGIRTETDEPFASSFVMMIIAGTEPFGDGAEVESVRFVLQSVAGF